MTFTFTDTNIRHNYDPVIEPIEITVKNLGPGAPSSVTGSYTGDGTNFTYTVNPIAGAEYSKDGL
jgi:hypothetical protein